MSTKNPKHLLRTRCVLCGHQVQQPLHKLCPGCKLKNDTQKLMRVES